MFKLAYAIGTFCILALSSAPAWAGPDEDVRDAALAEAKTSRSEGWPQQRCYAGVSFFNNVIAKGNGNLLAGDEMLYISSTHVDGKTSDEIREVLADIPPQTTVVVQVRRGQEVVDVQQPCGNIADYQNAYLNALDFAGKKDWYDCIDALSADGADIRYLTLRARCARVSRKADEYPIQQWIDTAAEETVSIGQYAGDDRYGIADNILKSRIEISRPVYESLVGRIQSWDSGETWDQVQPDYDAMRRAAEGGVLGRLIDPQSAMIELPYDFIYGTWSPAFSGYKIDGFMTCGSVNAKNRMGGYTGATTFISVIDRAGFEKFTDMDDPTAQYIRPVEAGCASLVKKLNYVGNIQSQEPAARLVESQGSSVADQLSKLAELHASGALTEEEYEAAKARVLE